MQVRLLDSITGTGFNYGKGHVLTESDQPIEILRSFVRAGLAEPLPEVEARETAINKSADNRKKTTK